MKITVCVRLVSVSVHDIYSSAFLSRTLASSSPFRLLSPSSRHRSVSLRREKKISWRLQTRCPGTGSNCRGMMLHKDSGRERHSDKDDCEIRLILNTFPLNICDSISQSRSASRCGCQLNVGGILRVSFLLKIAEDYSSKSKIMSERQSKLRNVLAGSGGLGEIALYSLLSFFCRIKNQTMNG